MSVFNLTCCGSGTAVPAPGLDATAVIRHTLLVGEITTYVNAGLIGFPNSTVEVNGLGLIFGTDYTIDGGTGTITWTLPRIAGEEIEIIKVA